MKLLLSTIAYIAQTFRAEYSKIDRHHSLMGIPLKVALSNGECITLENIESTITAKTLKSKISTKTGIHPERQSFWFWDYPLRDDPMGPWDDYCRGSALQVRIDSPPKDRSKKPRHKDRKKK